MLRKFVDKEKIKKTHQLSPQETALDNKFLNKNNNNKEIYLKFAICSLPSFLIVELIRFSGTPPA